MDIVTLKHNCVTHKLKNITCFCRIPEGSAMEISVFLLALGYINCNLNDKTIK